MKRGEKKKDQKLYWKWFPSAGIDYLRNKYTMFFFSPLGYFACWIEHRRHNAMREVVRLFKVNRSWKSGGDQQERRKSFKETWSFQPFPWTKKNWKSHFGSLRVGSSFFYSMMEREKEGKWAILADGSPTQVDVSPPHRRFGHWWFPHYSPLLAGAPWWFDVT